MSLQRGDDLVTSGRAEQRMRLFIAVELPPTWIHALGEEARRLESAAPGFGRWVDPGLLHLTLVFLGNQPSSQVTEVKGAMRLAVASIRPFELRAGMLGCFGSSRAVRVIWAGIEASPVGALAQLRDTLATSLTASRVGFDETPFRPHITLARARRDATPSQSELMHRALTGRHWHLVPEAFQCSAITLIHSELRPRGPIYTPLHRQEIAS